MNGYDPMREYQYNQLLAQQAMIQNQLSQLRQPSNPRFTPYPQQQPTQPTFFVRQVGNVDEAKGYPADPGTMYLFLDTGTGRIYLKQLNVMTGKSDFYTYSVQEQVADKPKADPFEQINERLANIEKMIGGNYDKPIPVSSGGGKPNGNIATAVAGENASAEPTAVPTGTADDKRKE